jgi:tryptophan synthase beta subunit
VQLAKKLEPGKDLVINVNSRGDKDMLQVAKIMGVAI